jgi:hypothetical protein
VSAFNCLYIMWSIIGIEPTIRWNGFQNVNTLLSAGQHIPFIVGVVEVAQVAIEVCLLFVEVIFIILDSR